MIPLSKPVITEEMKKKVLEVLDSGRFIKGPRVKEFEEEFARYCGVRYGTAVSSGTAAIYLALRALDIKEGDEVITPSHSFIATAEPILMVGAKPVFVDIGEDYNLDVDDVKRKITDRTRDVICVHLYGQMCDMDRLIELTDKHGLYLIEDAAQAHGAEYDGKKAGSFGDLACFSFFPSKNMTVAGDGGMVVTNDGELDAKIKSLRDHGRDYRKEDGKFSSTMLGFNFRMSEISAVIGIEQLRHLDEWIDKRREIANWYNELLEANDEIMRPKEFERRKHAYHLYVIRSEKRDELKEFLFSKGIETGIHYPLAIHQQPIFSGNYNLPKTERICREVLSLPMYPGLKEEEVEFVCEKVNEFFK
jgi:dTDP-4-amino-4,6-dideoxygalactose transaminase